MQLRACSGDVLSRTANRKEGLLPASPRRSSLHRPFRGGEFTLLRVREIYTRTVNLEEPESGRRYSVVTSGEDFGPRTWLTDLLPPLRQGELLSLPGEGIPARYDPSLPAGRMNLRWVPLVCEWSSLLEEELESLAAPARERRFGDLLGLGPGSTPAGDDFLAGYTTGRLWLGTPLPPLPDTSRTTWLSAEILRDAADGLVWKRSKDVLESLSLNDPAALLKAVERILGWGHTSGRAWLAGLSAAVSDTIERNV